MSLDEVALSKEASTPPEKPIFLDAPEHPRLAQFGAYIDRKRGPRPLADRSDINPAEILSFLPHLVILDVIDQGEDFRVRVFGTALVELLREERTGQLVSQFGQSYRIPTDPVELRSRWLKICQMTIAGGESLFFKSPTVSAERAYMVYHGMFAPLTAGTAEISQIIGMMIPVNVK